MDRAMTYFLTIYRFSGSSFRSFCPCLPFCVFWPCFTLFNLNSGSLSGKAFFPPEIVASYAAPVTANTHKARHRLLTHRAWFGHCFRSAAVLALLAHHSGVMTDGTTLNLTWLEHACASSCLVKLDTVCDNRQPARQTHTYLCRTLRMV